MQEDSECGDSLTWPPFGMLPAEIGERDPIRNNPFGQNRVMPRFSGRLSEQYASRLEIETPELGVSVSEIHKHITSVSHRIKWPSADAKPQDAVARFVVELSTLGDHPKTSINEKLPNGRPFLEED